MIEKVEGKKKRRNRSNFSNRATLSPEALEKVLGWRDQISKKFDGVIKISSTSDLLNLILSLHEKELSSSELEKIKENKLSDVQLAKWIYDRLLAANGKGETADLNKTIKEAKQLGKVTQGKNKKTNKDQNFKVDKTQVGT